MTFSVARNSYPALGREYRIRSFVPNIHTIGGTIKRLFEYLDEQFRDTLEQVFAFPLAMDTVSIVWS